MNASNKRDSVATMMKAWESKNARRALQGAGLSTMAVTLAACGGSSTTPAPANPTPVPPAPATDAPVAAALQISSVTGVFDNITGGSGADTFTAGSGALETGDVVNGAGGADVLSATYTADASVIATISNVETINVRAYGNDVDVTFNMDSVTGVTTVYADRVDNVTAANDASVVVDNLVIGTGVGIKGGAAAATSAGAVTFNFKSTSGTADSASLDLQGALVHNVTIAGIETINISSTVGANLLADLVVDGASVINVTGNQNLTITAEVDMLDTTSTTTGAIDGTVDASAFTGNLSFVAGTGDNMKITGGAGSDTFAMTTGLDKYDLLNGGAGNDTVSVTGVADGTTLDLSTYSFTSIETFSVQGAAGAAEDPNNLTIAADAAGVTKLVLVESQAHADGANGTDEGTFTVTGLSSGNTIRLVNDKVDADNATQVSQIGAVTLSLLDGSATTDVLNIELAGTTAQTAAENTVDDLAITNVETLNILSTNSGTKVTDALTATDDNTLGDISADTNLTALNISGSDQANITVGSEATKLAAVNTTGMTNDLTLTLQAAADQTVTGGDAKETVAFGSTLNNKDTVNLGGGTDTISATITSLTATTGALKVANVETLNLTNAGTAVIDATAVTGASEIAILTNTTKTTITGLAANTAIGLGFNDTDGDVDGIVDVALANATGTADTLTVNLNDTAGANTNTVDLRMTGVETLALVYTDTTDTALADTALDVDAVNVSKITVTGANGDVGHTLGLGTLDTDTTAVDASGYHGIMTVAAGAAIATSFTARGDVKHSMTGSSKNDTFTITTATTNADMTINGNGGTDTLNMVLGTGAQDFDSITDVDTINFTASGTVAITTDADADVLDGINEATKVTFAGGNSISTITLGGANDTLTATNTAVLDFSKWAGKLSDATFAKDTFDNGEAGITVQVIGSALADTVSASYDAGTDPTVSLNMQGIETFDIHLEDDAAELRVDMALVTGLTKINVTDTSDERVEFYNLGTGVTIDVTATDTTNTTVEVVLADATGSADTQTFVVAAASADDNVAIVAADIETLNISSDTANQVDLSLAGVSMTAAAARNTVNFTGTNDIELVATGADITTINASGMGTGGAIVQTGRSATEASTYTGSDGNDTFIMMNAGDVLNGGAGTDDTLDINLVQAVGTAIIDLSAADQIASLNGGVNAAVQTGFENVDLAGVTGNGAVITGTSAANTITGSAAVDQIDGGAGNDVITGGGGIDTLTGGAGTDTFVVDNDTANRDVITDFAHGASGDVLNLSGVLTLDAAAAQSQIAAGTFNTVAAGSTGAVAFDAGDIVILTGSTATVGTATLVAAEFAAGEAFEAVTALDNFIVVAVDSDTGHAYVYEALDTGNTALAAGELTLLATLEGVSAADATLLVAANFGL